jgi:hypothetical protein
MEEYKLLQDKMLLIPFRKKRQRDEDSDSDHSESQNGYDSKRRKVESDRNGTFHQNSTNGASQIQEVCKSVILLYLQYSYIVAYLQA